MGWLAGCCGWPGAVAGRVGWRARSGGWQGEEAGRVGWLAGWLEGIFRVKNVLE